MSRQGFEELRRLFWCCAPAAAEAVQFQARGSVQIRQPNAVAQIQKGVWLQDVGGKPGEIPEGIALDGVGCERMSRI